MLVLVLIVGEGHANLGDTSQWRLVSQELIRSSTQLRNLLIVEYMYPSLRVVLVILCFPDSLPRNLLGETRIWLDVIRQGRVLTRGLDAVGKDLSVHRLLGGV